MIPLSIPHISGNEWKYIKECLDSNWVSSAGKYVDLFEQKIAEFTGSKYAIACVNGTAALQVSLRLAGVQPGDEVIAPTLTFIAPINAIAYNGAEPVFMDADDYYNIDSQKTVRFIQEETEYRAGFTFNKTTGKRISAIVPVHVWGNACWLDKLVEICFERNIAIIEDASESLGTRYLKGNFTGKHTGTIGKLGCISFNGNKIITTGGGGMIITDEAELASKARYLTTQAKDDELKYVHNEIGYNFRLTNIQAALGVAQLEQLDRFLSIKKDIFTYYKTCLEGRKDIKIAEVPIYSNNNHWLSIVQFNSENYDINIDRLLRKLHARGIQARPIWHLNHLQNPYIGCKSFQIKNASRLSFSSLCVPSSVGLDKKDIIKIISELHG